MPMVGPVAFEIAYPEIVNTTSLNSPLGIGNPSADNKFTFSEDLLKSSKFINFVLYFGISMANASR